MNARRALALDVLVECRAWDKALDGAAAFARRVLERAAALEGAGGGVSLLLTDDGAMQTLNRGFRGKDAPTNVLAFPAAPNAHGLIGDVALGFGVCAREAEDAARDFSAHAAHLLVHGYLHLVGYDHEAEAEAERMESRERAILAELGLPDPYVLTR